MMLVDVLRRDNPDPGTQQVRFIFGFRPKWADEPPCKPALRPALTDRGSVGASPSPPVARPHRKASGRKAKPAAAPLILLTAAV
jgi:hypothetical protein